MNRVTQVLAALVVFLVVADATFAQLPVPLVLEGQTLRGGERVTSIAFVHVDAFGNWLVQVTTDQPARPSAVLRSGALWKQVGDPLPEPAGARIGGFDCFASEAFGGAIWNATLLDTPGGAADDEALFFENALWIQEGPIGPWPDTDFPDGSRWVSFGDVRVTAQSGYVLLRGRADDPTVAGPDETFAAMGTLCGSIGVLCTLERIAHEGQPAPGTGELIEAVRLSPASAAIAPVASTMVWSADLTGPSGADACVYRFTWPAESTLLVREGAPSPVPGRTWGSLEDPGVDVNSAGTWTLRAELDASDPSTDAIIVRNGFVFVREGSSLPAIAPATLDDLGRGRALIDQAGFVVWYGRWEESGRPVEGLFREGQLLVRTGTTTIHGRRLVALGSGPDDLALTADGDVLVFKGTLVGGVEGAFQIDLDSN